MNPQQINALLTQAAAAGVTISVTVHRGPQLLVEGLSAPAIVARAAIRPFEDMFRLVGQVTVATENLITVFTSFFTRVAQGFIQLMGVAEPFFQLIAGTPWLGEFQQAAQVLTLLFQNLQRIVGTFGMTLRTAAEVAAAAFQTVAATIRMTADLAVAAIRVVQTAVESLAAIASAVTAHFTNIISALARGVSTVASAVTVALALGAVLKASPLATTTMVGAAGAMASLGVLFGLIPAVVEAAGSYAGALLGQAILQALIPSLQDLHPVLFAILLPTIVAVSRLVSQLLDVLGVFGEVLGRILEALGTALQRLAEGFGRLVEITVGAAQRYLEVIIGLWQYFGAVAARADTVNIALQVMARNWGINRREVLGLWESLRGLNISMIESGEALTMLLARHPALAVVIKDLGRAAQDWAAAMGFTTAHVLQMFTAAVTRGSMEMLEHLNIVYPASVAYQLFAVQIGKSADSLNYLERSLAVANFLINVIGQSVRGVYEETFDSLGKLLTSFQRVFQELQVEAGRFLIRPFDAIARTFYEILRVLTENLRGGGGFAQLFAQIGSGIVQGILAAFRVSDISRLPRTVAEMLNAVLNSAAFQQFAQRLGALAATLTYYFASFLRWLIENLPAVLNRLLEYIRAFLAALVWIWNYLYGLFEGLVTALRLLGYQVGLTGSAAERVVSVMTSLGLVVAQAISTIIQWAATGMMLLADFFDIVATAFAESVPTLLQFAEIVIEVVATIGWTYDIIVATLSVIGEVFSIFVSNIKLAYYELMETLSQLPVIGHLFGDPAEWQQRQLEEMMAIDQSIQEIQQAWQQLAGGSAAFWQEWATTALENVAALLYTIEGWLNEHMPLWSQRVREWATTLLMWGQILLQVFEYAAIRAGQAGQAFIDATRTWLVPGAAWERRIREEFVPQRLEAVRIPVEAQERLLRALDAEANALERLFGRHRDIVLLRLVQAQLAWEIVRAEALNLIQLYQVIQGHMTLRDNLMPVITELMERLRRAYETWAQQVMKVFEVIVERAERIARITERFRELPRSEFFLTPAGVVQTAAWHLQALQGVSQALSLWLSLPNLGVGQRLELMDRLLNTHIRILQTEYELVNQPMRMILDGINAIQRYWRTAVDLLREFNLGMYGLVDVHVQEARVLAEKIRLLELHAQINRYNYQIYWQIRQEILETKRELFEIARRPVLFFGMTREQIERSFREAEGMMADPRFWARWRLAGPVAAAAAWRLAVLQTQPGAAAVQMPDPRILALLGAGDLAAVLGSYPLLRVWSLVEMVTGRRFPVDMRTVAMALRHFLLADIMGTPPHLLGPPPPGYFTQFATTVWWESLRWGRPLPEPYIQIAQETLAIQGEIKEDLMSLVIEAVRIRELLEWAITGRVVALPPLTERQMEDLRRFYWREMERLRRLQDPFGQRQFIWLLPTPWVTTVPYTGGLIPPPPFGGPGYPQAPTFVPYGGYQPMPGHPAFGPYGGYQPMPGHPAFGPYGGYQPVPGHPAFGPYGGYQPMPGHPAPQGYSQPPTIPPTVATPMVPSQPWQPPVPPAPPPLNISPQTIEHYQRLGDLYQERARVRQQLRIVERQMTQLQQELQQTSPQRQTRISAYTEEWVRRKEREQQIRQALQDLLEKFYEDPGSFFPAPIRAIHMWLLRRRLGQELDERARQLNVPYHYLWPYFKLLHETSPWLYEQVTRPLPEKERLDWWIKVQSDIERQRIWERLMREYRERVWLYVVRPQVEALQRQLDEQRTRLRMLDRQIRDLQEDEAAMWDNLIKLQRRRNELLQRLQQLEQSIQQMRQQQPTTMRLYQQMWQQQQHLWRQQQPFLVEEIHARSPWEELVRRQPPPPPPQWQPYYGVPGRVPRMRVVTPEGRVREWEWDYQKGWMVEVTAQPARLQVKLPDGQTAGTIHLNPNILQQIAMQVIEELLRSGVLGIPYGGRI